VGRREPVITIDGPAGAGKSTVARLLAGRLGYRLVPTGAMYRAVAFGITRDGVPPREGPELRRYLEPLRLGVADGRVYLNDEDVTAAIRTPEVAQATSYLTTLPAVRAKVTPLQQREAASGGVVLEGRDTGTVVCPDAEVKFYLTASLEARAGRRHAELAARGTRMPLSRVRKEVHTRDEQDETRELAPLRRAPDAIEVDTSDLSVDEVVGRMLAAIQAWRGARPSRQA
jgi:cytidylate kinase